MELICYPLLSRESKLAISRKKKSWGHNYHYNPQNRLVMRLAKQLNKTPEQIREQLQKEREFILKYGRYY